MQLGWIDFSKEDRQKAFDVINLLSEQGAVDELGIGVIRDAFANYFFPGTSTIQNRAKYFLIVPYVLREAVDGKYYHDGKQCDHHDFRHTLQTVLQAAGTYDDTDDYHPVSYTHLRAHET